MWAPIKTLAELQAELDQARVNQGDAEEASPPPPRNEKPMTYQYEDDPRDAEIERLKTELAEAKKKSAPAPKIDQAALREQIERDVAAKIANETKAEREARLDRIDKESTSAQDFERRLHADGLTQQRGGHYTRSDRYQE